MNAIGILFLLLLGLLAIVLAVLFIRRARFRQKVRQTWESLQASTTTSPDPPQPERFSPDLVADLPAPVQRYFTHALAPGTPLHTSVELTMQGFIKLGKGWSPFTARQLIVPGHGFVWDTRATMSTMGAMRAMVVEGADLYANREGHMHFALFGLLPVVNRADEHVRRSAVGRLLGESVWAPAALLPQCGVQWEAIDDTHINATMSVEGETITLQMKIDETGRLKHLVFDRWNTDQQQYVRFGMAAQVDDTFRGVTIPSQIHAGWWFGTERYEPEGEFFRSTIEHAEYGAGSSTAGHRPTTEA